MRLKLNVNHIRKIIMIGLTRKIGKDIVVKDFSNKDLGEVKHVLINRPNNRLGNQILTSALIQEIKFLFPNCKIDLFVRGGVASILFINDERIDRIIQLPKKPFKQLLKYLLVWYSIRRYKYDLVINTVNLSSSGRLSTKLAKAKIKFFSNTIEELQQIHDDYLHHAKYTVYNLRHFLSQASIEIKENEIPVLDINLTSSEILNGKDILDKIIDTNKKTIGIYTFATGDKCYSKEWWGEFYDQIVRKFGDQYNIVEILPIENVSQINFQAPSYYGTDIREVASVIANTEIFIGADSGIMHLASAAKTPVVGLFSITSITQYGPYGNNSIGVDTNITGKDDILEIVDNILSLKNNKASTLNLPEKSNYQD